MVKSRFHLKRNTSVTMKAIPNPIATILNLDLDTGILLEYSCDTFRSSEVIRSIIAMAASQRLRSESVKGISISITFTYYRKPRKKQVLS
jgi:hypothetical protein